MTDRVVVHPSDANFVFVEAPPHVFREIQDTFTVYAPGYKFSPLFKQGFWDGKIRYLQSDGRIYKGLMKRVEDFCLESGYEYHSLVPKPDETFTVADARAFAEKLNLPFKPDDFQVEAVSHAVEEQRSLLVSPTASGKSLIAYMIARHYDANTLIVVPTVSLVSQMAKDIRSYGYSDGIHEIRAGQSKDSVDKITIATWQSVYKMDESWYTRIAAVIGDEAHLFKAKSLVKVMGNLPHCDLRFGLTGSLDGTETGQLLVEGLFGPVFTVAKTMDLVESGRISEFTIDAVRLTYSDSVRKYFTKQKDKPKKTYAEEMKFFSQYETRNKFLRQLSLSLGGATLLLFHTIEHGKKLYEDIRKHTDRPVFLVHGAVEAEDREKVRESVARGDEPIAIASFGTFSTGIDMPNLRNLILGAGVGKSRVRVLQSIGRTIRKHHGKTVARIIDVGDDAGLKGGMNHSLSHFNQRLSLYAREGFRYRIHDVKIGEPT